MIELKSVTHHYGVRPVLRDVNVHIKTGSVVAIVGPNGMGKTTLMGVMAGTLSPFQGETLIDGFRRRGSPEEELEIRRRVVYLPDHPWLPKNRTGREFLIAVGRLYDIDDLALFDHCDRLLDLFQLVKEGDWPIRSYSNGQKKKIAIAATLITECPIMLLDEPFGGGLDPAGIVALQSVLSRLGAGGDRTIVMTAPAPELIESVARQFLILRDGQVVAYDSMEGIRRLVRANGSLTEALAELIHPDTVQSLQRYFGERKP